MEHFFGIAAGMIAAFCLGFICGTTHRRKLNYRQTLELLREIERTTGERDD